MSKLDIPVKWRLPLVLVFLAMLVILAIGFVSSMDNKQAQANQEDFSQYAALPIETSSRGLTKQWFLEDGLHIKEISSYYALFEGRIPLHAGPGGQTLDPNVPVSFAVPPLAGCTGIQEINAAFSTDGNALSGNQLGQLTTTVSGFLPTLVGAGSADYISGQKFSWSVLQGMVSPLVRSQVTSVTVTNTTSQQITLWSLTLRYDCQTTDMQGFSSYSRPADAGVDFSSSSALLAATGVTDPGPSLWRNVGGVPFQLTQMYNLDPAIGLDKDMDVFTLVVWPSSSPQPTFSAAVTGEWKMLGSANGYNLAILAFQTGDQTGPYILSGNTAILGVSARPSTSAQ